MKERALIGSSRNFDNKLLVEGGIRYQPAQGGALVDHRLPHKGFVSDRDVDYRKRVPMYKIHSAERLAEFTRLQLQVQRQAQRSQIRFFDLGVQLAPLPLEDGIKIGAGVGIDDRTQRKFDSLHKRVPIAVALAGVERSEVADCADIRIQVG